MIRKRSLKINFEKLKVFLKLHIAHTITKSLYCLVYVFGVKVNFFALLFTDNTGVGNY